VGYLLQNFKGVVVLVVVVSFYTRRKFAHAELLNPNAIGVTDD